LAIYPTRTNSPTHFIDKIWRQHLLSTASS